VKRRTTRASLNWHSAFLFCFVLFRFFRPKKMPAPITPKRVYIHPRQQQRPGICRRQQETNNAPDRADYHDPRTMNTMIQLDCWRTSAPPWSRHLRPSSTRGITAVATILPFFGKTLKRWQSPFCLFVLCCGQVCVQLLFIFICHYYDNRLMANNHWQETVQLSPSFT